MAERKLEKSNKKQKGQFMTPSELAMSIMKNVRFDSNSVVLEPSFGTGSFLILIIEQLLGVNPTQEKFNEVMENQVFGVELDTKLYRQAIKAIEEKWWRLPDNHNLVNEDFFKVPYFSNFFTHVIGNPPFGGTFDPEIEDYLDKTYGKWKKYKIKKETYSFFVAKSLEILRPTGELLFILSDTFITISTMRGLRYLLTDTSKVKITSIEYFSEETDYPMVVLEAVKGELKDYITINNEKILISSLEKMGAYSWGADEKFLKYFNGPLLSDYIICSSGMTVGKNELFLRTIVDDQIVEPLHFSFFEDPITLEKERERARLNYLPPLKEKEIIEKERAGETQLNLKVSELKEPKIIQLPHPDYAYYNKSSNKRFYAKPTTVIYWKDDGRAVLTFKKNGNWYLRGVGGAKFFGKEGMTWQLIGSAIKMRYLPPGFILDSGAPCGFLNEGVDRDELWFIIGWTNSTLATRILKTVINHTRNIQGKDIEKLPYPYWVNEAGKKAVINKVKKWVKALEKGEELPTNWQEDIDEIFDH